ncbi:MAG: extracellular solute-binding protein [Blastocatellales bacterium]
MTKQPQPQSVSAVDRKYLSTGFKHLDDLLGGPGFLRESVILVRGEPGTGKTSLALQIARNAIKNFDHYLVFVCAEDKPEISLNQITESYWNQDYKTYLGNQDRWQALDIEVLTESWNSLPEAAAEEIKKGKKTIWSLIGFGSSDEATKEDLTRKKLRELGQEEIDKMRMEDLLGSLWKWFMPEREKPLLVVIDSLSALIYWAQRHFRAYDDRYMLLAIIRSFEKRWEQMRIKPTVIFTAEDAETIHSKTAESYIADVVIQLQRETITHPIPIAMEKSADWQEDLLFCRVLKGRGLPTQRRSCCYEFVKDPENKEKNGIDFFPTYAAQGLISLFHENLPQFEVIQNLRKVDMPSSYPGVIVQEFTLSGLQRMFAVRRYVRKIPPRHPMLLSHVDEYWVQVLKEAGLLYPIPSEALRIYSLPLSDDNQVIKELSEAKAKRYLDDSSEPGKVNFLAVPQMGNVGLMVYRKDLLRSIGIETPPETWEELESIGRELQSPDLPHPLLIETQTYDTLLVTALELGWGHGSFWSTKRDEENKERLFIKLESDNEACFDDFVVSLERLRRWIHEDKFVPMQSSVDPAKHPKTDWVFARHWYSTWVDYRTRPNKKKSSLMAQIKESDEFGIAKIPISKEYMKRQNTHLPKHHSSSGEWYLVIQANSENVELGIDLINNLMSSRKVTERALAGVELPVMEKFYEAYGSVSCYGTDKTFSEMRQMFAADARSRAEFDDYRKVGRVLYGVLQAVVTNQSVNVRELLVDAFRRLDPDFKP